MSDAEAKHKYINIQYSFTKSCNFQQGRFHHQERVACHIKENEQRTGKYLSLPRSTSKNLEEPESTSREATQSTWKNLQVEYQINLLCTSREKVVYCILRAYINGQLQKGSRYDVSHDLTDGISQLLGQS